MTFPMQDDFRETAARLLRGAWDLNCRCDPSPGYGQDHIEVSAEASSLGLAGLVFRDDAYCTTPIASLLMETSFRDGGIALSGSVTLNNISGGLNLYAAEHALMLGGRIVSMPTISSQNHLRMTRWPRRQDSRGPKPRAITVLDDRGRVRDDALEVLDIIADRDGVLDAGALHVSEILPLFCAARRAGVSRLLVSDPFRRNALDLDDLGEILEAGAFVEFLPQQDAVEAASIGIVRRLAPDRLILGLDVGPSPRSLSLTGRYRQAVGFWLSLGFDEAEIQRCMKENVEQLLCLEQAAGRQMELAS